MLLGCSTAACLPACMHATTPWTALADPPTHPPVACPPIRRFAFAFYLLMTIIRLAEGATSCCGSKKRFVQQPQVVVMQPGSYYAGPPPADGQFMTAPGTEKMYEKV